MKWVKVEWSSEAEAMLADALLSDSHIVKAEVKAGESVLWHIEEHGYFITRLENNGNEKELVLVAWQGKNTGPLIEYLKSVCEKLGIKSMRFHTAHREKVINRFVKKWGFMHVETVYRVEVL